MPAKKTRANPAKRADVASWFVYILRCADGSLYTGIATDVDRRVDEHNSDAKAAARYTRSRRPVKLLYREPASDRSAATRREFAIKRASRAEKLALIGGASSALRNS